MAAVSYIYAVRSLQTVEAVEQLRSHVNRTYQRNEMNMSAFSLRYTYADALKFAVMYEHEEYVQHLLEHHAEDAFKEQACCPVVFIAVYSGFASIVELLCRHAQKANVVKNERCYIDSPGCTALENGKIPLQVAVELGMVDVTKILLRYGADLMASDRQVSILDRFLTSAVCKTDTQRHPHQFDVDSFGEGCMWQCVLQLLRCESKLTVNVRENLAKLAEMANEHLELDIDAPVRLQDQCRNCIRHYIGHQRLPLGISQLQLPTTLKKFIDFE